MQQNLAAVEPGTRGYVLYDPEAEWVVNAQSLQSLSQNTHLLGQTLRGRVLRLL